MAGMTRTKIRTPTGQRKMGKVMGEFSRRTLHSSSGDLVTKPAQAKAIGLSEGRRAERGLSFKSPRKRRFGSTPRRPRSRRLIGG